MDNKKRCIFHIPNYIDMSRKSASNIRPFKMIEAFKENGYIVDVVMGYAKDRRQKIKDIKANIKNGINYEFMYSESSTMPTLLTEKNHLPLHPLLDFSFMKYCKKNGVKIGLFYRDIYWKFEEYKQEVHGLKRFFAILLYKYDLKKYRKLLDILYIPSKRFMNSLPKKSITCKKYEIKTLFPGCDNLVSKTTSEEESNVLKLFYVGGITDNIYDFRELFKIVSQESDVQFTVCCRETEWNKVKSLYNEYMSENIHIVHKGGEELKKYYNSNDLCSMIFNKNKYRDMAMPMKLFEYLANNKPIIATKNTAAGEFVDENKIGWTIEYTEKEIQNILRYLKQNRDEIKKISEKQKEIIKHNTWKARAEQVSKDLKF